MYVWRNGDGQTLVEVDWSGRGETGWYNTYFFHQPALEQATAAEDRGHSGDPAFELELHSADQMRRAAAAAPVQAWERLVPHRAGVLHHHDQPDLSGAARRLYAGVGRRPCDDVKNEEKTGPAQPVGANADRPAVPAWLKSCRRARRPPT